MILSTPIAATEWHCVPYVATELSTPDGLPCMTFSAMKAHSLINRNSESLYFISIVGMGIHPLRARSPLATQTLYEAEEPSPAPTGKVDLTQTSNPIGLEPSLIVF